MIPFGLAVLGLAVSLFFARQRAFPPKDVSQASRKKAANSNARALLAAIKSQSRAIDANRDGSITKDELVAAAPILNLSPAKAAELFDALDVEKIGRVKHSAATPWHETLGGRFFLSFCYLYLTVAPCACFFMLYTPEAEALELTWADAFYFGTVVATTIGMPCALGHL